MTSSSPSRQRLNVGAFDDVFGRVREDSVVAIVGPPGVGKSILMSQMALAFVRQAEDVVYIGAEETREAQEMRFGYVGASAEETSRIALHAGLDMEETLQKIREFPARRVFVDSLSLLESSFGAGERRAAEALWSASLMEGILFVSAHAGRRGMSSAAEYLADVVVDIRRRETDDPFLSVCVLKHRFDREPLGKRFRFYLNRDGFSKYVGREGAVSDESVPLGDVTAGRSLTPEQVWAGQFR